jgi:hypothetical protein
MGGLLVRQWVATSRGPEHRVKDIDVGRRGMALRRRNVETICAAEHQDLPNQPFAVIPRMPHLRYALARSELTTSSERGGRAEDNGSRRELPARSRSAVLTRHADLLQTARVPAWAPDRCPLESIGASVWLLKLVVAVSERMVRLESHQRRHETSEPLA